MKEVSQSKNIKDMYKSRFMKSKEKEHENHAKSFQMKTNQPNEIINQPFKPKMMFDHQKNSFVRLDQTTHRIHYKARIDDPLAQTHKYHHISDL